MKFLETIDKEKILQASGKEQSPDLKGEKEWHENSGIRTECQKIMKRCFQNSEEKILFKPEDRLKKFSCIQGPRKLIFCSSFSGFYSECAPTKARCGSRQRKTRNPRKFNTAPKKRAESNEHRLQQERGFHTRVPSKIGKLIVFLLHISICGAAVDYESV